MQKNPILVILVLVNSLGVLLLYFNQKSLDEKILAKADENLPAENKPIEERKAKIKEGNVLTELRLPPVAANLARQSGPQRYLKINMTFLCETPQSAEALEITSSMPTIRDEIIRYLNSKSVRDILKFSGKEVVKNHIKDYSNNLLKTDRVEDIYFTRFEVN